MDAKEIAEILTASGKTVSVAEADTAGLIGCVPHLSFNPTEERLPLTDIPGVVPPLTRLGKGCPFSPRCIKALDKCGREMPPQSVVGEDHRASCWLIEIDEI